MGVSISIHNWLFASGDRLLEQAVFIRWLKTEKTSMVSFKIYFDMNHKA